MKMTLAALAAVLLVSTSADAALSRYRIDFSSAPRTPGGPRITGQFVIEGDPDVLANIPATTALISATFPDFPEVFSPGGLEISDLFVAFGGLYIDDVGILGSDGTRGFNLFACLEESAACFDSSIPYIAVVDGLGLNYRAGVGQTSTDLIATVTLISGPGRSVPGAVPAPAALGLFGLGALGLVLRRR